MRGDNRQNAVPISIILFWIRFRFMNGTVLFRFLLCVSEFGGSVSELCYSCSIFVMCFWIRFCFRIVLFVFDLLCARLWIRFCFRIVLFVFDFFYAFIVLFVFDFCYAFLNSVLLKRIIEIGTAFWRLWPLIHSKLCCLTDDRLKSYVLIDQRGSPAPILSLQQ